MVISLNEGVNINCKLTDFGSARNVNMMMTNMTFTKGVGTPAYMAPEILERKKYKMPSDIYSFGTTILEILIWGDAYPKKDYKFPWDIAECVTNGQLPKTIELIENEQMKNVVLNCMKLNPEERLKINEMIEELQDGDCLF